MTEKNLTNILLNMIEIYYVDVLHTRDKWKSMCNKMWNRIHLAK